MQLVEITVPQNKEISQMVNYLFWKSIIVILSEFAVHFVFNKGTNEIVQYLFQSTLQREGFLCWWEDFALILIITWYLTLTTGWLFPDSLISCTLASSVLFVVPPWSHLGFGDIVRPVIAISSGSNDSDRSLVLCKTFVSHVSCDAGACKILNMIK